VFESGAILIYLAEKSGRFLGRTAAERSSVLQWLMLQMSTLGPVFGQASHFALVVPNESAYARRRLVSDAIRLCEVYDARLSTCAYVAGEEFSIADIAAFPWLWKHPGMLGIDTGAYQGLRRWLSEIEHRPGFRTHYDQYVALYKRDRVERDAASSDAVDRFF